MALQTVGFLPSQDLVFLDGGPVRELNVPIFLPLGGRKLRNIEVCGLTEVTRARLLFRG